MQRRVERTNSRTLDGFNAAEGTVEMGFYLVERKLQVTPARRHPDTPLIGSLEQGRVAAISGVRSEERAGRRKLAGQQVLPE
jgi:hypothetical protein